MPGITPIADVPDAPTIGAVTDSGDGTTATVAYTAAVTGGTVTTFTATSTPGSFTGTGSSPISVTGLTAGTAYTFKVKGTNSTATGPESAASGSLTLVTPPGFDSIATLSGTGSSGVITFSSIPQTYKHLQIRAIAPVGNYIGGKIQFNSDTGTNYNRHTLLGNGGGTVQATTSGTSQTYIQLGNDNGYGRSSYPYNMVIDILDYTNTGKNKTMRMIAGFDTNNTDGGEVCMQSGLWLSTSAINTITFGVTSGNYPTTAKFALYGIKG